MKGVLGREERAHQQSMGTGQHTNLKKGTQYSVNKHGNSNVRIPSRRQSKAMEEEYVTPGYEYVHVPKNKEDKDEVGKKGKGANPGGKKPPSKSPYASSYYTKQQARSREEELLAKKLAQHGYTMGSDSKGAKKGVHSSGGEAISEEEEQKRKDLSDALRQERASWLQQKLPTMTLKELLRITEASGLPAHPFAERHELVKSLCKHYGITDPSTLAGRRASMDEISGDTHQGVAKKGGGARRGSAVGVSPAEAALKSKLNTGNNNATSSGSGVPTMEGAGGRHWEGVPVDSDMSTLEEVVQTATGQKDGADLYARKAKGAEGNSKVVPPLPKMPSHTRRSSTAESGSTNSSRSAGARSRSGSRGPSSARGSGPQGGKITPRYAQDTSSSNQSSNNNSDYRRRKQDSPPTVSSERVGVDQVSPRGITGGVKSGLKGMHPGQYITKERLKELEKRVIGQGRIRGRNGKEAIKSNKHGSTSTTSATRTSSGSGKDTQARDTKNTAMPSLDSLLSSAAKQAARYDLRHSYDAEAEEGVTNKGGEEKVESEPVRVDSTNSTHDGNNNNNNNNNDNDDDYDDDDDDDDDEEEEEDDDGLEDSFVERLRSKGWDFNNLGLNLEGVKAEKKSADGVGDGTTGATDDTTTMMDDTSSVASGTASRHSAATVATFQTEGSSLGTGKSGDDDEEDPVDGDGKEATINIAVGDDSDEDDDNVEASDSSVEATPPAPGDTSDRTGLSDQISPIITTALPHVNSMPGASRPGSASKGRSPVEADKDKEAGREQVFAAFIEGLEAEEDGGYVAVPPKEALSGRIRARRRSGVKDQGGSDSTDTANPTPLTTNTAAKSKPVGLTLDLSQLSSTTPNHADLGNEGDNVQEEVDFWVHSARSDEGTGNSYRDLDRELKRRIAMDKENVEWMGSDPEGQIQSLPGQVSAISNKGPRSPDQEKPRAVSPIVSPKHTEQEEGQTQGKGFIFFG